MSPYYAISIHSDGRINLNSQGVLTVGNMQGSSGGSLHLDRGVLRASQGFSIAVSFNTILESGGGTIDNNGHEFAMYSIISGSGGLTLTGSGTTTLGRV